jgi:hypothetical protein
VELNLGKARGEQAIRECAFGFDNLPTQNQ